MSKIGGKNGDKPGRLEALRASAEAALRRLAPAGKQQPAPAKTDASFASLDPTQAFMPGAGADDEPLADDLSFSLDRRLGDSAQSITQRQAMLQRGACDLKAVMADRAGGEKSLTIWGVRFLIGAVWLGMALWLNQSALYARANDQATIFAGVPLQDVAPLMNAFVIAGAAGTAFAVLMIAFVFISGNASNERLRAQAEKFGDNLAQTARDLNAALKSHRNKVVESDRGGGVAAASQAHLVALEASYFFRSISFLTTVNPDNADDAYRRFLNRYCPPGSGFNIVDVLAMGLLGALIGLGAGWRLFREPTQAVDPTPLAIMQYPWAAQLLLFGGLAYLLFGIVIEAFSGAVGRREMTKARKDALDSMRSAYTAQEAPLESEVVRQVEDVVAILAARLGGGAGANPARSANQTGADYAGQDDIPEWRRRDSSVKFVEAGFSPAPGRWRTDAYAKKFEGESPRGPGSKRDGDALKKGPRD